MELVFWFDVEESELSGVGGAFHVAASMNVAVIPAGARGARDEGISAHSAGRHDRRAFFLGTIHFGRNEQAVPVNHFRNFGFVEYVYGDGLALAHA
jgi:hypothetical protein